MGESMRHLLNCSREADYNSNISALRESLRSRGYPETFLPTTPYDPAKREHAMERLRRRNLSDRRDRKCTQKLITLPVRYSDQQRSRLGSPPGGQKTGIDELRAVIWVKNSAQIHV